MSKIDTHEIKRLRELTGVGITDAKQALVAASGNFDEALKAMRAKGLTKADKRSEREARCGVIGSYVHDGRIGVLIEVNCETDFVAKNEIFTNLVKDLAMHIAASAPRFISTDQVPADEVNRLKIEFAEKIKNEGKPEAMRAQIVDGMVSKHLNEQSLQQQPFVKNPEQTVGDYVKETIAKLGENIVVRRFERMALGELSDD